MSRGDVRWKSSQGVATGLDAIEAFEGDIVSCAIVESPFEGDDKEYCEIRCEGVEITQVVEGSKTPELKDDELSFLVAYAKKGKEPTKQGFFMKYFLPTAEKLELEMPNVTGVRCGFRKKEVKYGYDENGDRIVARKFVFEYVAGSTELEDDYVADLLEGSPKAKVIRKLGMDKRTKSDSDLIAHAKSDFEYFLSSFGLALDENDVVIRA